MSGSLHTSFVVQSLSHVRLFVTPWTTAHQASLSFTISQRLLTLISVESVMPSNHLILCHPLLFLHSVFPSIRVFSNELTLHIRWQNIGASASASVLPMNIQDWFPLRLTGLILQSKGLSGVFSSPTVLKHQFLSAQPSFWFNSHICTWLLENHSFDYGTFVSKVISLLFNTLSRFIIAFFPRRKYLLISWLQSPSTVILEPKKINENSEFLSWGCNYCTTVTVR